MAEPDRPSLLDEVRSVLVVVAHPDDESFGLGAILAHLIASGAEATVLCFTGGEASTLGRAAGELAEIRAAELAAAGAVLGIGRTELLRFPDGRLNRSPVGVLAGHVRRLARQVRPSHLLAFDVGGITGHPDHVHATRAAMAAAGELGLPVLGWTLPQGAAEILNREFDAGFTGRREPGWALKVDRAAQLRAIGCHRSQATGNPVLYRRLELLGDTEFLRLLRPGPVSGFGPRDERKETLMGYGMTVRVHRPFAETVERIRVALKDQGFGVLTEIDVRATLLDRLGEQMEDYLILGACNPPLAHRALRADRRIGLLLPCNVVVRADGDDTVVEALDPQTMVTVTGRSDLGPVADEAARRLTRALETLAA